jgi:hypothetical protein
MLAVTDIRPTDARTEICQTSAGSLAEVAYPEAENFQQQFVPRMLEYPPIVGMAQSSTNVEPILPIGDAPRSSIDEPSSFAYRNEKSIVLSSSLSREEEKVDLESELEKLIDNERPSNEELDQSGLQDVALQGPSNSTNHYHPPLPSTNYPSGGKTCMAQDLVFQMGDENPTGVNSSGVSSHVGWRSDHDLHPQADDQDRRTVEGELNNIIKINSQKDPCAGIDPYKIKPAAPAGATEPKLRRGPYDMDVAADPRATTARMGSATHRLGTDGERSHDTQPMELDFGIVENFTTAKSSSSSVYL